MIPPSIRAVYFDAVGTLVHPDPSAGGIYFAMGQRWGSKHSEEVITRRFNAAFQAEEELDRLAGGLTSEQRELERWQRIVGKVLDDVRDFPVCFRELYDHFAQSQAWRVEQDAGPVLGELSRRNLLLGMASNYDARLRSVVENLPDLRVLRDLIISSEVGWRKPTSHFFQVLIDRSELPPEQILYVGDDPINDFAGAQNAGLRAILFDPRNRHQTVTEARIARLGELLSFFQM